MVHIKPFKQISKKDVPEAGGKGASLGEMTQAGIPVPPGFVVLANAFDRFTAETGLNEEIKARLEAVNPEDVNSVEKASVVLRDVIHDTAMPKDLSNEILAAYDKLGAEFVAVRSSATAEDSLVASWAGELETYLNTPRKNVTEKVKQCWSSLFTPRAIFYRHEKNLIDHYVSVAVVVQKMVQSEISGVAFSVHPVTEDRNQIIIEAGFGLGEAIVSGQITPDSYVVDKTNWTILDINIAEQEKMMVKKAGAGNVWKPVIKTKKEAQKLSGKQIIDLAKMIVKIEKHYNFPCDIEWAMNKGKFYITQSRPITTLMK